MYIRMGDKGSSEGNVVGDPYTSIRVRISTVKKLEMFKLHSKDSLESVIKKAIAGKLLKIKEDIK